MVLLHTRYYNYLQLAIRIRRHFRNALHSIKTWPLLRSFMVNLGIWNNGILEIKLWLSMTFDPCYPGLRIQLTAPAWSFYTRPLQGKVARINVSWKEQKRILGWVLSGKFFRNFCSFRKTIMIPMGEEVYRACLLEEWRGSKWRRLKRERWDDEKKLEKRRREVLDSSI